MDFVKKRPCGYLITYEVAGVSNGLKKTPRATVVERSELALGAVLSGMLIV